jgi:hypothetical protein
MLTYLEEGAYEMARLARSWRKLPALHDCFAEIAARRGRLGHDRSLPSGTGVGKPKPGVSPGCPPWAQSSLPDDVPLCPSIGIGGNTHAQRLHSARPEVVDQAIQSSRTGIKPHGRSPLKVQS